MHALARPPTEDIATTSLWAVLLRSWLRVLVVSGVVGARHLIGEHAELVTEIEAEDGGIFLDIDTPEAYRTLKDKSGE